MIKTTLKQFAHTDGLLRGTALLSNLASTVTIALLPGFGANALLFSNFLQMSIAGLLEIPTGWIADRFGWARAVIFALQLKMIVTLAFIGAVFAASRSNAELAWILIAAEAIVDSFSSAFLSGAYQAGYLKWYESMLKKHGISLESAPPLFLASFGYAAPVRFALPIAAAILLFFC
jgi:hypothetical protein